MQTAYFPASAAEFPNDNPGLHQGVRWVCRHTLGAARALLRAPLPGNGASSSSASGAREEGALVPEPSRSRSAAELTRPAPSESESDPARLRLRLVGPLELDLDRIVLPHRVENVPPPPEFIFRPFVSSRARDLRLALETLAAPPLEPLGYRIVDQRAASRRVQRGWRVDVAPCLSIGVAALEHPLRAASAPVVAMTVDSMPTETMPVIPMPVESAPVESMPVELVRPEPARRESARRTRRRAASLATRALSPSPVPSGGELERAISDLEAAFAERASERPRGEERRRSPRGVSCTSLSSAVLSALSAVGV